MFLGQVRSHMKGRESFQEIDPKTSFGSMSKAVLEPNSAQEMVTMARQAIEISQSGRPGPVVVVMPRDFGETKVDKDIETRPYERKQVLSDQKSLNELIDELNKSVKPILLAGELARGENVRDLLVKLSDKLGAPVMSAYRCQDVVENHHPCYAGPLEIIPVEYQDKLFKESDFIAVLGSRLDGITSREETLIKDDDKWAHIHPDRIVLQLSLIHI